MEGIVSSGLYMAQHQYIRDQAALDELAGQVRDAPRIALDTEFMRERTYYAKLCLVQIATDDVLAAVDPLAVDNLEPLWNAVNGGPEVVFHAASQDLEIIAGLAGRVPERHFDTQIAAAFLGYGDSIGYARLVDRIIGRTPGHSEAYTDWTRRPLSDSQIEYALDDVRYLLEIADRLSGELDAAQRGSWVREELDAIASAVQPEADPEAMWRKVRGARSLRGRKLAALQEVAAWREREAQRRDIPRQRVVPDRILVEIAKRGPKRMKQVENLRGLHPREAQRSGQALIDAVARAAALPEAEYPDWGTPPARVGDPRIEMMAALLDSVLRGEAAKMRLSSRILANRRDLEALARWRLEERDEEPRLPVLRGWRRESVGALLLDVLHGRQAVALETRDDTGLQLHLRSTSGGEE
ncbi:MAG: ribonuclease D [Acidobacteria bacterium]|nr:ribonuclease D [Acidobacteriota bacterium]